MKIFVQTTSDDEQLFYTRLPWYKSVDVICCNEVGAKMLEEF